MAIDFPASPTNGQTFTSGSVTYTYDGTKWTALASGGGATDKIEEGNTSAEVIDTGSDGRFVVTTEGSERLRVDSSGRVGIGDNAPSYRLTSSISSTGTSISSPANTDIALGLLNTGAATTNQTLPILFRYADGTYNGNSLIAAVRESGTGRGQSFVFAPSNSSGDPTERMRIRSDGRFLVGTTDGSTPSVANKSFSIIYGNSDTAAAYFASYANDGIEVDRKFNDGGLISFRQDGTQEGTISVSGTTVSYNGAHLSRWSQLVGINPYDKTARPEILRGTVMSNLDEMCDWTCPTSGGCQDNEQLNKTEISSVDDDPNVAGVFQSWDDDDDTWVNDFYLAMTGDFVIRIAAGTTVQRGDLLCSAGDGTAKPQGDDIVRSKTIAKVTSTTVSCTHPDGSYCVPCVLMAC